MDQKNDCLNVIIEVIIAIMYIIGVLSKAFLIELLQISLLKPRQVNVISLLLMPIKISTAVGDESEQRSSTTLLIQSRY